MDVLRRLLAARMRLRAVLFGSRLDRDLDEELRTHVEESTNRVSPGYFDMFRPASGCSPSTAPTSARRCTRRCRAISGCRPATSKVALKWNSPSYAQERGA